MMIDQIAIQLGDSCKINQVKNHFTIKSELREESCAEKIRIEFEENYSIDLQQGKSGKTVVVLTAGGIHRVMDLATLQHLVAMTY